MIVVILVAVAVAVYVALCADVPLRNYSLTLT